jgi:hypothetical protein
MGTGPQTYEKMYFAYLESLRNFQFSIANPVFWVFLVILFLILLRFWLPKKSFSFCLIVAIVLLGETQAENYLTGLLAKSQETMDLTIIKVISLLIIFVTFIYYAFIKGE